MFGRKKIAVLVAEFLGTGVLSLVVLSVQRSTLGLPFFIAVAAGLAIAALSLIFGGISGAHFNPAITIGMWSARKVRTLPAITYVVAQLLGGWAAYGTYTYFVNSSLQKIGGNFTLRIMIAEAVGVLIFSLVWAAVAAQRLSASIVGAGFALGALVASSASLALLNPAVAIASRAWVVWGSLGWGTYVLGPVVGGIVGFNLYELFFAEGRMFASKAAVVTSSASSSASTTKAESSKPKKTAAKKPAARRTTKKK